MLSKNRTVSHKNKSKEKTITSRQKPKPHKKSIDQFPHCPSKRIIKPRQTEHQNKQQKQNYNTMNIVLPKKQHKISKNHVQSHEHFESVSNLMKKSASTKAIRNINQTRKSFSPTANKPQKQRIQQSKQKHPTKSVNKQGKVKIISVPLKKVEGATERPTLSRKQSQRYIKASTQRIRTQGSSNFPDNILDKICKEMNKKKKSKTTTTKTKKPKQKQQQKQKVLDGRVKKPKIQLQNEGEVRSPLFFSGPDPRHEDHQSPVCSTMATKQQFYAKVQQHHQNDDQLLLKAVTTIQKYFKGYLTRKIIEEIKQKVYYVIKVQTVLRAFLDKKKIHMIRSQKNLSVDNSILTFKNFEEEKIKNKNLVFNMEESISDISSVNRKGEDEEKDKYVRILQNLLLQQGLEERFKQKIRKTLGNEKYVQSKILSQLNSQKSFNSPRQAKTFKQNMILNSPLSWSKSKSIDIVLNDNQISQGLSVNCQPNQMIFKRINSPTAKSVCTSYQIHNVLQTGQILSLKPFKTSFEFIEEFQFKIVDFFKENLHIKEIFNSICKKSERFKTNNIIKQFNKNFQNKCFQYQNIFSYTDNTPDYFPNHLRKPIMNESAMKIYLQESDYFEYDWHTNPIQKQMYEAFIKCIFDGLSEAIYEIYYPEIITNKFKGSVCRQVGHELFKAIFSNGLTLMQSWCEYICGAEIPVCKEQPTYVIYKERSQERINDMVKSDSCSIKDFDEHGWTLWANMMIGQAVFQHLVEELTHQFFI